MFGEGRKELEIDILLHLPKEISLKVLSYLTGKELSVVCNVSKNWRDLANYNLLWKKLCVREALCADNETMRSETLKDGCILEPECKWAQIYHEKRRLISNWAGDKFTWMAIDQDNPSVDVYHNVLAVAYWVDITPTVDIVDIKSSALLRLQTLTLPFNLAPQLVNVNVRINSSVITIELSNISVLYKYENDKYIYDLTIVPDLKLACTGKEQEFVDKYRSGVSRCWTLCLAGRYIWFQASTAVVIYDRNEKTFQNMNDILQVVAVEINGELIVVQCPHSVRVFYVDGKLLYTYSAYANLFYTGLVMSSTSFAFLQSEDFSDPNVVQMELGTWQEYKETQLKVYRIALHKNLTLLLSQDPFTLTSMSQGDIKWTNFIRGTKYLRPGKDFFTVICSRYVFVCPSLARLDMFSLYDVNTGDHLYDTSLNTSSYNIQTVSDACLVVHSKKTTVNIRSYV